MPRGDVVASRNGWRASHLRTFLSGLQKKPIETRMRIGLFGGTFDPIHWGHLRSAEEVSETFGLDRVVFIPASIPPHKRGQTTTPARDRLEMVRLGGGEKSPVQRIDGGDFTAWGFLFHRYSCAISPREERRGDSLFYYRPGCISGNRLLEEFCGDFSTL